MFRISNDIMNINIQFVHIKHNLIWMTQQNRTKYSLKDTIFIYYCFVCDFLVTERKWPRRESDLEEHSEKSTETFTTFTARHTTQIGTYTKCNGVCVCLWTHIHTHCLTSGPLLFKNKQKMTNSDLRVNVEGNCELVVFLLFGGIIIPVHHNCKGA